MAKKARREFLKTSVAATGVVSASRVSAEAGESSKDESTAPS
jgi:hypothetical protein